MKERTQNILCKKAGTLGQSQKDIDLSIVHSMGSIGEQHVNDFTTFITIEVNPNSLHNSRSHFSGHAMVNYERYATVHYGLCAVIDFGRYAMVHYGP